VAGINICLKQIQQKPVDGSVLAADWPRNVSAEVAYYAHGLVGHDRHLCHKEEGSKKKKQEVSFSSQLFRYSRAPN
jgi:hypothetical protein